MNSRKVLRFNSAGRCFIQLIIRQLNISRFTFFNFSAFFICGTGFTPLVFNSNGLPWPVFESLNL